MQTHFNLGSVAGCGGGFSGGSRTGSVSTLSKEENLAMSSEDSSSYPDESELELGLGLSLGGGSAKSKAGPRAQLARIWTAEDFPSTASSSSVGKSNPSCGTKRAADSVSPTRSGVSQVVGWPPVGTYRMSSLVNSSKSPITEEFPSLIEKTKTTKTVAETCDNGDSNMNSDPKEKGKTSLFVKVNMDGAPIGRKVDLNAHASYDSLAQTLEDMFYRSAMAAHTRSTNAEERLMKDLSSRTRLLDGSSDFVLTYEDKDGDWMLVGDVPWVMFISSVKRLRIMRTSDANGLAPRFQESNPKHRTKPI